MGEGNFSFEVVEDRSRESSFQLSHPQQKDTSQAEKTLKRKICEGGGVRIFGRLKDRVNVPCMALTKQGAPCKNPASWALGIGGLEVLVCGTHRRMVEKRDEEINSIEDLKDLGFYLKRKEERAYRPIPPDKKRGGE
ncbi:hypothetical protein AKJ65_00315 [candidate division MSBL1 archaeon SCGC-AAA259E19]|uniref:Uncharacterized protein n=1 Tax=candidate division MSBL1 archaeon SCGC-AAA259E19 TaxID=1698264 RepID=A0A133UNZ3_9EURY|nr:hypothetical protein AKJ65_00315 [candidate division MSBL1 archaeon SCGC-AAA259E19]